MGGGEGLKTDRQRGNKAKGDGQGGKEESTNREAELSMGSVQRRPLAGSVLTLIQPNGQQVPLGFSGQLILLEPSKERFQRGLNKSA